MRVLREYGIQTPTLELATSAKEAVAAAERIGYPVVLKICDPTILHKSDAGLVRVGVTSAREVRQVFAEFMAVAPEADGVLVCQQMSGGVECVIGVAADELFGPVVMVGLGGVLVEVLGDVTFRVPPFGKDEAARMLDELKGAAILKGVRGRPASDTKALVDVIMRVQRLAVDLAADVAELDINPLLVGPKGSGQAVALDALIVAR
jgi:acyl-CoA synthetase (NDP forming)